MLPMTEDERTAVNGFEDVLGEHPDAWGAQIGQTAAATPWLRGFVLRMWRQGIQRRDSQVRDLWRLLRQQRRLGRRTWVRRFLTTAWRQGMPARDPRIRQFVQQVREWGLLPQRLYRPSPWYGPGAPSWYQRRPWRYARRPSWYRPAPAVRVIPPTMIRPRVPAGVFPPPPAVARAAQAAINPVVRAALGPGGLGPTVAHLPGQALRTAASVATAPARFTSSLFR